MNRQSPADASPLTHGLGAAAVSPLFCRIAIARRTVKELTAIAEKRAAQAAKFRATATFRPLADAEALIGADLLAQVAAQRPAFLTDKRGASVSSPSCCRGLRRLPVQAVC
jgi:hypothetical protein